MRDGGGLNFIGRIEIVEGGLIREKNFRIFFAFQALNPY